MKTCGMMGEVVGRAASICVANDCNPRDVYTTHWAKMDTLLKLPGKARRDTVSDEIVVPDDSLPLAGPLGPISGLDPEKLAGLVIDDTQAKKTGNWTSGTGLKGYVGYHYLYASADSDASISFVAKAPKAGRFDIRIAYQPHENRGTQVPALIQTDRVSQLVRVNMKNRPQGEDGFASLGQIDLKQDETCTVEISTKDAGGIVHADAVQFLPLDE